MRDGKQISSALEHLQLILDFYKSLGLKALPIDSSKLSCLAVKKLSTKENTLDSPLVATEPIKHAPFKPQPADTSLFNDLIASLSRELTQASPEPSKQIALQGLKEQIGDCKRCKLASGRTNLVFGTGNPEAQLMFVGEGPGAEEDLQGLPFVGDAGKILTNLITKMGQQYALEYATKPFSRGDVYIANVVKCRPPHNRDPEPDEITACVGFLFRQIEIIDPKIIVTLGRVSTHTLMKSPEPLKGFSIGKVRGRFFELQLKDKTIPVMPTFHPAYFLRNPKEKHKTWQDMLQVLKSLKSIKSF